MRGAFRYVYPIIEALDAPTDNEIQTDRNRIIEDIKDFEKTIHTISFINLNYN